MAELFASGRFIELVMALTVAEAAGLVLYHRATRRGVAPGDFLANLLSGLCLMMAIRAALVGAWGGWLAIWLLAALLCHLTDLVRRWKFSA